MCGIAGIVNLNGAPLDAGTAGVLRAMAHQLAHRGPDDEQISLDGPVGMAFRRLAVVDLDGGRQPMENEDGSLRLMVNGEIYNHLELRRELREDHHFQSSSDSEVLLHLYEERGIDLVEGLNGMFAFALWDRRRRRLFLARDRLGIKPLYYAVVDGTLLFASELKALFAHPRCPRRLDWQAALSYDRSPHSSDSALTSFFVGIEYLPGGQLVEVDLDRGTTERRRYWWLEPREEAEYAADLRRPEEIVEGYRALLDEAVRLRLMADVEVGVFLSGGIDSVAICAIAAKSESLHTFSVLSQSTLGSGDAASAHRAAERLGLPNHQVLFRWQDLPFDAEAWKRLLWLLETPLCGAEQLYKYLLHQYARATRPELKVILLGQGSDEFNGGYGRWFVRDVPEAEKDWPSFLRFLSTNEEWERRLQLSPALDRYAGLPVPVLRRELIAELSGKPFNRHPWFWNLHRSRYTLQMYNLWHEDRTAAGNGIENRVPFLDHRLVEYARDIPPRAFEELFWDKRILRQSFHHELPEALWSRPKGPFFYGTDVRYTWRMLLSAVIADNGALLEEAFPDPRHPVVDVDQLRDLFRIAAEDPEYASVPALIRLANIGLLERMSEEVPRFSATAGTAEPLPAVEISDWSQQEPEVALRLARTRESLDLDRPACLGPDSYLVRREGSASQLYYLVVGGELEFELDANESGPWIEVLRRIDGLRSIPDILVEVGLAEAAIRKELEEAIDYGVITFAARGFPERSQTNEKETKR